MNWLKKIGFGNVDRIEKKLDTLIQKEEEMRKIVTQMKKAESSMIQRLERVEQLLEMCSYGVTKEKRQCQLVVSFTSYAKRIYTVSLMLERLMNQTVKPDRIILYLSKENFPGREKDLPERVLDMCSFGLELRWCKGDMKSYKKIIPALKEFPNDIIITVDDDLYFDLDLIESLYNSYKKFPNAISAMRTHRIKFEEDGSIAPYSQWEKQYVEEDPMPHMDLLATTGAGTLFPPHIFSEEVCNEKEIMELCPTADDIWIKIMSVKNHIPVVPATKLRKLKYISGTQTETLWKTNKQSNDKQLTNLLKRYNVDKKFLSEMCYRAEDNES